jgi:hypothetical protein
MARIGKLTLYVEEQRYGHIIRVRTTGKKGTMVLGGVTFDQQYNYVNPTVTAAGFWLAHVNETAVLLA